MKYIYRWSVEAPVEAVYEILAPDRWLSFVHFYRGLESADPNWPEEGSSMPLSSRRGTLRTRGLPSENLLGLPA